MAKPQKRSEAKRKPGRPPSGRPVVDRYSGAVTPTTVMRIDAGLMERLRASAVKNKRTIKAEAELAIEEYLSR